MTLGWVDTYANEVLDGMFADPVYTAPSTHWIGLSSTTPNADGTNFTEPSGGNYGRVAVTAGTFSAASSRTKVNSSVITFPQASSDWAGGSPMSHWGLFDVSSGGTPRFVDALTTSETVLAGQTPQFGSGVLQLTDTFAMSTPAPSFSQTLSTDFDGVDEHATYTHTAELDGATRAIWSFWIESDTTSGVGRRVWAHWPSSGNYQYLFRFDSAHLRVFISPDGTLTNVYRQWNSVLVASTWQHYLIDYNGGTQTVTLYIDGINQGAADSSVGTLPASLPAVGGASLSMFGWSGSGLYFDGRIDEPAQWHDTDAASVSVSEVNNSQDPPDLDNLATTPSPAHWWRMGDGDTFPTIQDVGSHGTLRDATMQNMEPGDFVNNVP